MSTKLLLNIFLPSRELTQALHQHLDGMTYLTHWSESEADFFAWTSRNCHRIDCLILQSNQQLDAIMQQLRERDILLPAIILSRQAAGSGEGSPDNRNDNTKAVSSVESFEHCRNVIAAYHRAIACLTLSDLDQLERHIHQAIDQFLKLPAVSNTSPAHATAGDPAPSSHHVLLSLQQQRLNDKLRERLNYLGVYYKRNPENFLRHMSQADRQELLDKLRSDYRLIVLSYFSNDASLNQKIDDFVNVAFFADASVSQIVEIHMELMDAFAKQLKLEGRSEEILLDYRLTLIDVIAHLCEMYRRSIPRENQEK
ncbi:Circadian clock protein KaiA [Halomicronema hongdechloris C2206]|uniref:Circadian clock oscillator protein KaiA n=1 Tax=Halomicronema hongdechloris C2206 TaxID=1641165 RepID=A0A1Z3HJH3_9CYAN|nr:circadian clock protein KaiA [Halomicronema hongdechloris]ASC70257.1 Circadian clock protein KaiA [Halomicronema hongdechloris C2206]